MTALVDNFNFQMFASLPNPKPQFNSLRGKFETVMNKLNDLFVQYEMQDKVGAALLHRHHKLSEGEFLTENIFLQEKISVTSPSISLDSCVPHLFKIDMDTQENIVLLPIEFIKTDITEVNRLNSIIDLLKNNIQFLVELKEILYTFGIQDLLGLQLNHRQSLRSKNCFLVERSNKENRTSTITCEKEIPLNDLSRVIPVFFQFRLGRRFCEPCVLEDSCDCGCWPDCGDADCVCCPDC